MQFPKKITTATMGLETRQVEAIAVEQKPKAVAVLRVWGMISSREKGVSQYGEFSKFKGELAALNLVDGTEARSQTCILPQVAEAVVNNLFDKASKDGGAAQIALEITCQFNPSQKGGWKFSYGVKPLFEYKEDALSMIAKELPPPVMYGENGKKSKK